MNAKIQIDLTETDVAILLTQTNIVEKLNEQIASGALQARLNEALAALSSQEEAVEEETQEEEAVEEEFGIEEPSDYEEPECDGDCENCDLVTGLGKEKVDYMARVAPMSDFVNMVNAFSVAGATFNHWHIRWLDVGENREESVPFDGICMTLGNGDAEAYTQFVFNATGALIEAAVFDSNGDEIK